MINDDGIVPRCISVSQAAKLLAISTGSAYKLAHQYLNTATGLPCFRMGERILVPIEGLDALFKRCVPDRPPRTRIQWRRRRPGAARRRGFGATGSAYRRAGHATTLLLGASFVRPQPAMRLFARESRSTSVPS